jgi:hypothetical protein
MIWTYIRGAFRSVYWEGGRFPLSEQEQLESDSSDEVLQVEALMGWDGDRCACDECDCPRFKDGEDDGRCNECRGGRHWAE